MALKNAGIGIGIKMYPESCITKTFQPQNSKGATPIKDVRYSKAWKMAHFAFDALPLQPYVRSCYISYSYSQA